MTIALVAHDTKKELMVQFCIAYRQILSEHRLIATGTTGRLVAEATGLNVQRFLPGGHGGDQQIVARIACDEVDMLLFFRDPICAKPSEPNEMNLLRICDVHNIPVATNIQSRIDSGASILNVACSTDTPRVVAKIREQFPDVPIIASGGKTGESISATIAAGANAITYTPPSPAVLFKEMMEKYRE